MILFNLCLNVYLLYNWLGSDIPNLGSAITWRCEQMGAIRRPADRKDAASMAGFGCQLVNLVTWLAVIQKDLHKELNSHNLLYKRRFYLSISTNAHKVISTRRKLYSMDKSSVIADCLVVLERNTMIEYNCHVIGSSDSAERTLLTNTDAVDNLGMTCDFSHRRKCIKCKCMTKAVICISWCVHKILGLGLSFSLPFFAFTHCNQAFAFRVPCDIRNLARNWTNLILENMFLVHSVPNTNVAMSIYWLVRSCCSWTSFITYLQKQYRNHLDYNVLLLPEHCVPHIQLQA